MFIVLKVFNDGNLACFLDEERGKFIARFSLQKPYLRLAPGSIVRGEFVRGVGRYGFIKNISLEYLNLLGGNTAQFFLYFLLELNYLFLPQHQTSPENYVFLRASIESGALNWCQDRPAFGVVLSVFLLELLGFSSPAELDVSVDLQQVLDNWNLWKMTEGAGVGLTLPQVLELKYSSLWADSWLWISDCVKDHPQFKKIEKKWLGLLHENVGMGCGFEKMPFG